MTQWLSNDLSNAEKQTLRLDGEAFDGFIADIPQTPESRLGMLSELVPSRFVICHWSAAWVYIGLENSDERIHICHENQLRTSLVRNPLFYIHESRLKSHDTDEFAGGKITSPLRTVYDLVRTAPSANEAQERALLESVTQIARLDKTSFNTYFSGLLSRPGRKNKSLPKQRLLTLADSINVIDGIDSSDGIKDSVEMHRVAHFEDKPADS